jgi:hypothetical protein
MSGCRCPAESGRGRQPRARSRCAHGPASATARVDDHCCSEDAVGGPGDGLLGRREGSHNPRRLTASAGARGLGAADQDVAASSRPTVSASSSVGRPPSSSTRGTETQQRFDLAHIAPDLRLLLCCLPVRVVRPARDAAENDAERRAQPDDLVETVVEAALVVYRPRNHGPPCSASNAAMGGSSHMPSANAHAVVGIDDGVTATRQSLYRT